ncbi:MAG: serine hydrolase [Oligoflexia bacterium]|nr:serine hydrolase [Oligoflexia bacterium]
MKFQALQEIVERARDDGYPQCLQIQVNKGKRRLFRESWGPGYRLFDLASLTKIFVTVPLIMKFVSEKKLNLQSRVETVLPFFSGAVGKIAVTKLLTHHSGLVWWRAYHENLIQYAPSERRLALMRLIGKEPVKVQKTCVYSDPDFMILGWIAEELGGAPLDELAKTHIFDPLGIKDMFFLRERSKQINAFAPTSKTRLRGQIRGFVDDDNTWALGGVSGHAGLFGTLESVNQMGIHFLAAARGKNLPFAPSTLFKKFTQRAVSPKLGDWGLGFMKPSRPVSSAGVQSDPEAFGHTGFTGTSLWVDPKRDVSISILSNRVYPDREDSRFVKLRSHLHDAIWAEVDG